MKGDWVHVLAAKLEWGCIDGNLNEDIYSRLNFTLILVLYSWYLVQDS